MPGRGADRCGHQQPCGLGHAPGRRIARCHRRECRGGQLPPGGRHRGPIGIVIADSLLGEITPAMAAAVCQSDATRVLIPINHCDNIVVGVPDQPIGQLVTAAVEKVKELIR